MPNLEDKFLRHRAGVPDSEYIKQTERVSESELIIKHTGQGSNDSEATIYTMVGCLSDPDTENTRRSARDSNLSKYTKLDVTHTHTTVVIDTLGQVNVLTQKGGECPSLRFEMPSVYEREKTNMRKDIQIWLLGINQTKQLKLEVGTLRFTKMYLNLNFEWIQSKRQFVYLTEAVHT